MVLQESGQMYLETILVLSQKMQKVRSLDVAEYMNFAPPSVCRAVGILKKNGYVEADGKGCLSLTQEGAEIASKIYERHRLLTEFLIHLGVDESTAQEDACKIEHDISDESFEAIKAHAMGRSKQ